MPLVLARLDKVVNHEVAHAGFKKRAVVVDVQEELKANLGWLKVNLG